MFQIDRIVQELKLLLVKIISETNGVTLQDTLELLLQEPGIQEKASFRYIQEFRKLVSGFQNDEVDVSTLLNHPMGKAFFEFFRQFPLNYHEEHIHLTGSLNSNFIWPHLEKMIKGSNGKQILSKIQSVYGRDELVLESPENVDELIRLKEGEHFQTYLSL